MRYNNGTTCKTSIMTVSRFFGKLFSFLFNPLFMPLFGVLVVMYWAGDLLPIHPLAKKFLLIITAIFHSVLPLLTVVLMQLFGLTNKIELPNRRDRLMPIALSMVYAAFGYVFLLKIPQLNMLFYLLPLGSCVVLLVAFLFTMRFQISIHLMSVGALTATYVLAAQFLSANFYVPIIVSIVVAGCTAFARITLNAHKPYQVYWGYTVGFVAQYFSVILFYQFYVKA